LNTDLKIKTFNPKVSIIILSYNQAEYIKEAISSVLNQTYTNLEIIISDNGSIDSTKQIIKSVLSDDRMIFLDYKENQSISLRQNQAAQKASGEYISLLYADDYYLPTKIEHQVEIFTSLSNEWGVVHGPGIELDNKSGSKQPISSTKAHGNCLVQLLQEYSDGFINPIAPLVRTKTYLEFPLYEDIFSEGESLYWRIALKYKFFYSKAPLVVMRYHDQNMGKAIKKNMEMHLICLDRLATSLDFPKDAILPLAEYRAGIVFSNAWHCLRTNFEIAWAKKLILTSIKSTPKSLLSFRYFVGAIFILMPKKLIFYANKIINILSRKKFITPLEDYYN
jgi:glycosyltransferase involved in cell wall biosynthesis